MRIYRSSQKSDRLHGLTLPETGYKEKYVYIYRAVPKDVTTISYMDYVTRSRKFAEGHADHMSVTEEDDQHVIYAMVKAEDVAEASNPGEYFYIGETPVNGKEIYEAKYEDL